MNKRLTVGLLVSDFLDDYDHLVISGVMAEAKKKDVNLVIFPGRYFESKYANNESFMEASQFNAIFSYANTSSVDVLIIMLNSICSRLDEKKKLKFLEHYKNIPSVILSGNVEGYTCINFNNEAGMNKLLNHLISNKGVTKIGYISGPADNIDAIQRLDTYKKVLTEHNIEVNDQLIEYGDFTKNSQRKVERLLNNNPNIEAIVFANDTMAIGGYEVLKRRNIEIGKDLLVAGFDDSLVSTTLAPSLTSINSSLFETGARCVDEAIDLYNTKQTKDILIDTELVLRESTSDDTNDNAIESLTHSVNLLPIGKTEKESIINFVHDVENNSKGTQTLAKAANYFLSNLRKENENNTFISRVISHINRDVIREGEGDDYSFHKIVEKLVRLEFKSCYLYCLEKPFDCEHIIVDDDFINPSYFLLKSYFNENNGIVDIEEDNQFIPNTNVLNNKYINSDVRQTLFAFRIFMKNELLGMFVCEPSEDFMQHFYILNNQISATYKTIYLLKEHSLIRDRLNESLKIAEEKNDVLSYLSETDPLTGLPNRRYLNEVIDAIKADKSNYGSFGIVGMVDMNNLKLINDTFNHEEGDKAIINSAKIINNSLKPSGVAVRIGGDEFVALIPGKGNLTAKEVRDRIHNNFVEHNRKSVEPYNLEASVGLLEFEWNADTNFEELLTIVDIEMYKEKAYKKQTILK